jgi:hypothetical protein
MSKIRNCDWAWYRPVTTGGIKMEEIFSQFISDAKARPENNHLVGSLCSKLENMGYDVSIDGRRVKAKDLLPGDQPEYELRPGAFYIFSLFKNGKQDQDWLIDLGIAPCNSR